MNPSAGGDSRTALVLGSTGLVGGLVLEMLLADGAWERVTTLGRRPTWRQHPRLVEVVADFAQLDVEARAFAATDVFCCLGTTIAKAASQEAFYRVDHDYPVAAAKLASGQGARHFLIVTALGGNPASRVFYNRMKGEVERDVAAFPFQGVAILRPSLILGPRDERRPAEALAQRLAPLASPLLWGPLRRYRAIPATRVAAAMVRLAKHGVRGVRVLESDEIARVGK
jgi:uncharacterized protein YbjT (DUF2867 family)